MCGIAGKIDFGGRVDAQLLHRMCAVMEHRGPDSRGVFVDDGVGLGVQRLAIIDVVGGSQPIFNEDRTVAVVLNGEIYNFEQLRKRLVSSGHSFSSHADTEVLVHLYEDYGPEMVTHLHGMFAFAIWDAPKRQLFCARDRVGKKPLFWSQSGNRFWFASEIRALLEDKEVDRSIDLSALTAYLAYQYVPHPLSALEAIHKLPPACTLTVGEDGPHIERYWSLDYSQKLTDVSVTELEQRLWGELKEATRRRLTSEVPLGAFLSGGVDSSAVVAAMAQQMAEPVKTFSIGFSDAEFNELGYARLVAQHFGTDHREFQVEPDAIEIMPRLARHYGEPFGDASAIPSFYLAELTRQHVTVALNGDGGDESFGGYEERYLGGLRAQSLNWLPRPLQRSAPLVGRLVGQGKHFSSTRTQITRLSHILGMSQSGRYASFLTIFDDVRRRRLLTPEFAASVDGFRPEELVTRAWDRSTASDPVDRMMSTDVVTYLADDLLVKMDIATMAHSVEARSPFLDHHLMEFAAALPPEHKLDGTGGKLLLRRALRGILPAEVLGRPKMGFSVPLARWFREELAQIPADILLDRRSLDRGYFRRNEVEGLIREHQQHVANHGHRLWVLMQLEMWHREVVEAQTSAQQSPLASYPAPSDGSRREPSGMAKADEFSA
jgi:asparagine synthase (glutamine-hydrolysing)